jgi:hypothetical protein
LVSQIPDAAATRMISKCSSLPAAEMGRRWPVKRRASMAADFDSPWKEALEQPSTMLRPFVFATGKDTLSWLVSR